MQMYIILLLLIGLLIAVLFVNYRIKDCKPKAPTVVYKNIIADSTEYQLNVIDDSAVIYNNDRYVGTIKLTGTLDSLIISDNQ